MPKIQYGRHFYGSLFGNQMAKKQNFQNHYTKFVDWHTGKVHSKLQVQISMFDIQINVPLVSFTYQDLKVLGVMYLQANPNFKKS